MAMHRQLIVNADDFGMCVGVNSGVIRAYHNGIVTSTTLMANGAAFDDAVARLRDAPGLGVGVHLTLLGGPPVAPPSAVRSLLGTDGTLPNDLSAFMRRLVRRELKPTEIEVELRAQVERVLAAGIRPTHFDSHKHTHAHPLVLDVVLRVAEAYGVPSVRCPHERLTFVATAGLQYGQLMTLMRQKMSALALARYAAAFRSAVRAARRQIPDTFFGLAHTGLLNPALLCYMLRLLPGGTSELMCHPADWDETLRRYPTRLKAARVSELAALMDAGVREEIARQNIQLVSFAALNSHA